MSSTRQRASRRRKAVDDDVNAPLDDDSKNATLVTAASNSITTPMIPTGMLPAYMAEAFGELYEEDGLLCIGKGLQWLTLLASFCRFYSDTEFGHIAILHDELEESNQGKQENQEKVAAQKPPLVLVLGLRDETERSTLLQVLQSWGTPMQQLPTMITNESGQAKDRAALYVKGGILCITSRILIVDLLTGTVSSSDIAGILMAHAHTVTDQSTEAFIVRIFKSQKQQQQQQQQSDEGFVKAFTDNPEALVSDFAQVDKVMKALHVRKLYLYPRFRSSIRDELEVPNCISVTELHQELSKQQKEIQNAIAVLVLQCLRQLKSQTGHLVQTWSNNEGQELSVENCVTQQFDRAVSKQLDSVWQRLSPAVKQLVQDLRTLRTLFHALIQYDCIAFWKLLCSLRTMSAASKYPSMWLLEAATDALFRKAKERVYVIVYNNRTTTAPTTADAPKPVAQLVTVLEENPKWKLLKSVLHEIRQEDHDNQCKKSRDGTKSDADECGSYSKKNILVMVKDNKTLDTIKSYLTDETGKTNKTLQLRWLRYLEQCNDRSRSITDNRGGTSSLSEESRLLLEEEGRARRLLFGRNERRRRHHCGSSKEQQQEPKLLNQVPAYMRKRRKIAAEKGRGELTADDLARQAVLEEAVEATEHDLDEVVNDANKKLDEDDSSSDDEKLADSKQDESESEDEDVAMFNVSYAEEELRVVLHSYSSVEGDRGHLLLQDIRPKYVILYDTEVAFIRALEIYAALSAKKNGDDPIRVFFLMFEASAEEKNFKKALEREQNAFERLIHHKKTMPPPALQTLETQEMQQALHQGSGVAGTYAGGSLPLAFDTRSGRGKANTSKERRDIAVDVREFRSALPSILHQGGMRLAPVTLIVGDFVLSNVHCVERKSISDLFGSFASGRLYTQAEAMSKYYKCPCLLIEFDPNKAFCLQNSTELGVEIRTDSVCSKIALLAMHFPKLRILWSRSPHETLNIFRDLKAQHDEVDVERAMEIGRSESEEFLLQPDNQDCDENEINEVARDMLLRLPGVNVHSARRIMHECDSLADLCEMSRDDLRRIAGPVTGQKLFTFFRQKMGAS